MIYLISSLLTCCCLAPTPSKRREDHQNKLDHFASLSLSLSSLEASSLSKTPFLGSSLPPTRQSHGRRQQGRRRKFDVSSPFFFHGFSSSLSSSSRVYKPARAKAFFSRPIWGAEEGGGGEEMVETKKLKCFFFVVVLPGSRPATSSARCSPPRRCWRGRGTGARPRPTAARRRWGSCTAAAGREGSRCAWRSPGAGGAVGGGGRRRGREIFAGRALRDAAGRLFAPLVAAEPEDAGGEPVAVQALALQGFLRLCRSPEFQVIDQLAENISN